MSMHDERNYFKEFKGDCEVFVETGTYMGGGITLAVQAGFLEIHSIDLKDQLDPNYKHGLKTIYRHIGDSAEKLDQLLPTLKGRKTQFWLDAHSMLLEGEEESFPLMRELAVIKKHCNDGVILIDDFLYMSHPSVTGWSKKMIEDKIREINEGYRFEYLPNPIKGNILLARVVKHLTTRTAILPGKPIGEGPELNIPSHGKKMPKK